MKNIDIEIIKAIKQNDILTFKLLVKFIDVNKPIEIEERLCTPLQYLSSLEMERRNYLYSNGIKPKTDFNSDYEFAKILIKNGANLDLKERGIAPLINFVQFNNIEVVKLLIENGADLSISDNNNMTPLLISTKNKNKAMMNLLLYKGSNINLKNVNGDDYKSLYNYYFHSIILPSF